MTSDRDSSLTPERALAELTKEVWKRMGGHSDECPPEMFPTFSDLDKIITATAWAADARLEFNQRWEAVKEVLQSTFDGVDSFAQLTYMAWHSVSKPKKSRQHPLAPLIHAWHTRPAEVRAVRDADGALRGDTIIPRFAMRENGTKADRLYLPPAHIGDGDSQIPLLGLADPASPSRMPVLPVNLYDLGVRAGEQRGGGRGAAPIPARMLVKLAAAPSTSVRHGERFVTYTITLRDIRDAMYPPERLDGKPRQPYSVSRIWPRIWQAIQVINRDARIPILDLKNGTGRYHHLLRISENFGKITLDTPIEVVLDIPPEAEGGVQLPARLDQWGAESAPAYRALIGLSFLWHEPGRTHAPKGGYWMRKTGPDPYDPMTDDDAVALAFPSNITVNRRQLRRRAWEALENLEEHGELRIENRRILPILPRLL